MPFSRIFSSLSFNIIAYIFVFKYNICTQLIETNFVFVMFTHMYAYHTGYSSNVSGSRATQCNFCITFTTEQVTCNTMLPLYIYNLHCHSTICVTRNLSHSRGNHLHSSLFPDQICFCFLTLCTHSSLSFSLE